MALFSRKKMGGAKSRRNAKKETVAHLSDFVHTREGVAGYYEEETALVPSSLVLVALNGEWTRRKIPSLNDALAITEELGISLYEVARTGYPRSMREWSAKNSDSTTRQS